MRKQLHGAWVSELQSPDGASALIADHGAHLLSWVPVEGEPALYLSERSQYGGAHAIRGGVPIVFPQFGMRGPGLRHGFARVQSWRQDFAGVEQGQARMRYRLNHDDVEPAAWPHPFELVYEVAFSSRELHLSLSVHNPSGQAWEFNAALHTYLQVTDIGAIEITGLENGAYLDQTQDGAPATQGAESLRVDGEIDRIYLAVQKPVVLSDGKRSVTVEKRGFNDVVVWNPGAEKGAQIADMAPADYRSFVCIEAAAVDKPVRLGAGERWMGVQSITVSN